MAVETSHVTRDEVVVQRPEELRVRLPVFHTPTAGPGAATSYLLRRIAYRAGAYAPGIQEALFHELHTSRDGGSLEKVLRWFGARVADLHELGYRLQCRHVTERTATLVDWVRAGRGHRGAMLPTSFKRLHPQPGAAGDNTPADGIAHAVGLALDRLEPGAAQDDVVMIDPWPGVVGGALDRAALPPVLELAHRDRNFHALIYYWAGWS